MQFEFHNVHTTLSDKISIHLFTGMMKFRERQRKKEQGIYKHTIIMVLFTDIPPLSSVFNVRSRLRIVTNIIITPVKTSPKFFMPTL